jgi:hypothetical protein
VSTAVHESTTLAEAADVGSMRSGRMLVQAISAGLGSSGYYSPQVLERAANDRLISRGTPLHVDHASESERHDRPERSVSTIAGVFTGDARYDAERQALVGEVQIFHPYRDRLAEMAPYIGLSISGSATDITEGNVDGKRVKVIEGLHSIDSCDFVTRAGRGGMVLVAESATPETALIDHVTATYGQALTEAGLHIAQVETLSTDTNTAEEGLMTDALAPPEATATTETTTEAAAETTHTPSTTEETPMTETIAVAPATASTTEAARPVTETPPRNPREVMEAQIREQGRQINLLRAENRARDIVAEVLASGWIGDAQRARLTGSLVTNLPLTEAGALDEQGLRDRAQRGLDEAETEAAEILSAAGVGTPRGLGALTTPATESAGKQIDDELRESFRLAGLSDAAIDIAVKGR